MKITKNQFFFILFFVIIVIIMVKYNEKTINFSKDKTEFQSGIYSEDHIVIGVVVCSTNGNTVPKEETVALLKSVVISALLYYLPRITFHLFLEHKKDEEFFRQFSSEITNATQNFRIEFIYHSVLDSVPKAYRNQMIYDKSFRCGYVRIFFPDALPDVDSILYLDTDSIVTGNIGTLWNHLERMENDQMIGMVMANAAHNPYYIKTFKKWFGDIPHPTSKGLVSGLMLMNLTKMREYKVVEKMLRLYQDYSKFNTLADQKLINVFLYYAEGLLQLLPCQYNFRNTYCDIDFYCEEALTDHYGLQLVHGTASRFQPGHTFHQLYIHYHNVDIADAQKDGFKKLMRSVRNAYKKDSHYKKNMKNKIPSKCFGILNKILYRNFQFGME